MREMSSRLLALTFDGHDPARLAAFWAGVLVGPGQRQVRNNRVAPAVDLISLMGVLLGPAAGHRGEMKPGHGGPIRGG
jgi:hypothetical protein